MSRSLNKASLIGNLTKDPELRYTPQGTAVCTFTVATNRQWRTEGGDLRDEAEFHRIVAWDKLAEICAKMLSRGKKVFVEGRIQTRRWTGQDGQTRTTTEIVISDMLLLDRAREGHEEAAEPASQEEGDIDIPEDFVQEMETKKAPSPVSTPKPSSKEKTKKKVSKKKVDKTDKDQDIPF